MLNYNIYKIVLLIFILLCIWLSTIFPSHFSFPGALHQYTPSIHFSKGTPLKRPYYPKPKVWASMGLCYSETAKHNGKSSYPYKEVTYLSLLLWQYHLPEVSTMVRIVYTEQEVNETMLAYGEMLESAGAVVEWVRAEMDCVLQSQLVRLFAGEHPLVLEDDIVMTVDVNLFVMTKDILNPIFSNPRMTAWVPLYQLLFVDKEFSRDNPPRHKTFNQNMIAMRARTWLTITGYQGNLTQLVKSYEKIYKGANLEFGSWWYDQIITTHALLASKICTVPKDRWVWRMFSLKYDRHLEDTNTCWHGRGYTGCKAGSGNSHHPRLCLGCSSYKDCKWWHFSGKDRLAEHIKKFHGFSHHSIKLKVKNILKKI